MSEAKPFSLYEFDFNIMLLLACIGIFIKLMFEFGGVRSSNSTKATAAIIGYTLVVISLSSLLFVQLSLAKAADMKQAGILEFIRRLVSSSIPPLLMLFIIIWMIYININYYDRINSGTLTNEYNNISFISTGLILAQLSVVFLSISKNEPPSEDDDGVWAALQSNITSITYLLTLANIMFIGIINIILEYFATDG
tara:strand:+ start:654 stop:1241 length:588 start_codon:yes stop_codon:yes gene_type:complete